MGEYAPIEEKKRNNTWVTIDTNQTITIPKRKPNTLECKNAFYYHEDIRDQLYRSAV